MARTVEGIECHGMSRWRKEGDPEVGAIEVRFDGNNEPFIVLAVDGTDTFTESRYWQANEWADIPINPTYGKAARHILSREA